MDDQIRRLTPLVPFAIAAMVVPAAAVLVWWMGCQSTARLVVLLLDALLVAATAATLVLTLGRGGTPADRRLDLIPFRELDPYGYDHRAALFEMVGNVVLFAPIGALLALRYGGRSLVLIAAVGLVASLSIEATQYAMDVGREASVTDVILDTAGFTMGYSLARHLERRAAARGSAHAEGQS